MNVLDLGVRHKALWFMLFSDDIMLRSTNMIKNQRRRFFFTVWLFFGIKLVIIEKQTLYIVMKRTKKFSSSASNSFELLVEKLRFFLGELVIFHYPPQNKVKVVLSGCSWKSSWSRIITLPATLKFIDPTFDCYIRRWIVS